MLGHGARRMPALTPHVTISRSCFIAGTHLTITLPCMSCECSVQTYLYVPAFVEADRHALAPVDLVVGPSSTFTVWVKLSWFVQVTDVPALITIAPGSKR